MNVKAHPDSANNYAASRVSTLALCLVAFTMRAGSFGNSITIMKFTNHLGLSFINTGGEYIECWQLLDQDKIAVACADFRNGKLERFDAATNALNPAKKWLAGLQKHYRDIADKDYVTRAKGIIEYANGSLRLTH